MAKKKTVDEVPPHVADAINERNNSALARRQAVADALDGSRSADMADVDGHEVVGDFQDGAFEDSPEAREQRALEEEAEAASALQENADNAEREEARESARAAQEEGAEEEDPAAVSEEGAQSDEKVVNGERYYLQVVSGREVWLTLKQLRDSASKVQAAEIALQRANEAAKKAAQLASAQSGEPSEGGLDEAELESVINSAAMGDRDAVKKLASAIRSKPSQTPDVSRAVAEQIATQRAIDQAEDDQKDLIKHPQLASVFRGYLNQVAAETPDLTIQSAYNRAGARVRKDFAPMLTNGSRGPTKLERKRAIVNPPQSASRPVARADEEGEEAPGSVIDQIAKGRGQNRAIRHGRVSN